MRGTHLASWLSLALFSGYADAAPERWQSDPYATSMNITFLHSKLIDITAIAPDVSGIAVIDDASPEHCHVEFTVDLDHLISYGNRWANDLRKLMFDTANTPKLHFESTQIVRAADGYSAHGQLTVHGVTHPVTLHMSVADVLPFTLPTGLQRRWRGLTLTGELLWGDYGMREKVNPQLVNAPEYGPGFKFAMNVELVDASGPVP
jgi:polyisoprenoid-binding protein YceI